MADGAKLKHAGGGALAVTGTIALAGALTSAIAWTMHLTAKSADVPEYSRPVAAPATQDMGSARDAIARMFGATTHAAGAGAAREHEGVHLLGIISEGEGAGVALFSIDGAPPVRVRAGAQVRDGVKLAEVRQHQVVLERGAKRMEITLAQRTNAPDARAGDRQRGSPVGAPSAAGKVPAAGGLPPASVPAAR